MSNHPESHESCDPDNCFAAKARYWRENGAFGVTYYGGREHFHNNTNAAVERETIQGILDRGGTPERLPK